MQHDKPVKLAQVRIIRDKDTERIVDTKTMESSSYSAKNNAEAFLMKLDAKRYISKLKK